MRTPLCLTLLLTALTALCQPAPPAHRPVSAPAAAVDSWQVSVNPMDAERRRRITSVVEELHSRGGATRGLANDIIRAAGFSTISSVIDIVATEAVNLARYRQNQKKKWMRMIENECNYTDSISSLKGLNDFYAETSRYGALDPSNINFDGISVRGIRDGREMLYLSCHIDTTRLEHLFHHSKFYLVVDTMAFNPYECHLPNLSANGIRGAAADAAGRDNRFSFDERENLCVGMELVLTSSWINEAVMVQQNVELGRFKLTVDIPPGEQVFRYSRAERLRNRELMRANSEARLDTALISVEGDCFVVPRSFMPISGTERMWGTGEYNIKVKLREACRFSADATRNEKLKHWRDDYKRLRKMQNQGSEYTEYFRTLWQQNGDNLMKTVVKSGLSTSAQAAGLAQPATAMPGAAKGGAMPAGAGAPAAAQTGAPQQGPPPQK